MSKLEIDLAALAEMTAAQLRDKWSQIDDRPLPKVPPRLLRSLVASRLQERRHGALPALMRRELMRLADGEGNSDTSLPRRQQQSPGSRLVREWNGRTILVEVLEDGFRHEERTWRSLSQIARHVTGAHWSGPRFFGLAPHG